MSDYWNKQPLAAEFNNFCLCDAVKCHFCPCLSLCISCYRHHLCVCYMGPYRVTETKPQTLGPTLQYRLPTSVVRLNMKPQPNLDAPTSLSWKRSGLDIVLSSPFRRHMFYVRGYENSLIWKPEHPSPEYLTYLSPQFLSHFSKTQTAQSS